MDQFLSQWGPFSALFWVRTLWALAVCVIFLAIARAVQRGTQRSLQRAGAPLNAILFFGQVTQLALTALGVVIALAVLGEQLSTLAALAGLLTVALSLSLQDVFRNIIAGWYLLVERPFRVGDTVQVGGQQGVIEDVRLRTTILRSAEGDRVIVPNLVMFTTVVTHKKVKE